MSRGIRPRGGDAGGAEDRERIAEARTTGGVGWRGLYVPSDPGPLDEQRRQGMMMMSFGKFCGKVWVSLLATGCGKVGVDTDFGA